MTDPRQIGGGIDPAATLYTDPLTITSTTTVKAGRYYGETLWSGLVEATFTVPTIPGDYDGSGMVDEGDYVVWKGAFGQSGVGLPADGNGDGQVDAADYSVWRDNLGSTAAGAGGGSIDVLPVSVVEPSSAVVVVATDAAEGQTMSETADTPLDIGAFRWLGGVGPALASHATSSRVARHHSAAPAADKAFELLLIKSQNAPPPRGARRLEVNLTSQSSANDWQEGLDFWDAALADLADPLAD